jgi:formylglycine-generating enzyme required for sulfatase activity
MKTANVNPIVWVIHMSLMTIMLLAGHASLTAAEDIESGYVLIEGGTFKMGDVFGDGFENERPVQEVTVSDFYLARHEVTVGSFREFTEETEYSTSAEADYDAEVMKKLIARAQSPGVTAEDRMQIKRDILKMGGTAYWDADACQWTGYDPNITWRNVGFEQRTDHPVLAVSPWDAIHYCNWLSRKAGLPEAYNVPTGELLDAHGNPTSDVREVRGFRLPTEAEWEYAAREGGLEVRFGNGKNVASSDQINFRGDAGNYEYLSKGAYRKGTTPVGSFAPNQLGLFDMSGNAWEWTTDCRGTYTDDAVINPCKNDGVHTLRGGRWGGDAFEARVFHRTFWPRNDRCNNSGFRVARSK